MRQRCIRLSILGLCLAWVFAGSLFAQTIADSVDGWSLDGVQGENGWSYGYFNFTEDDDGIYATDEFIPFLNDDSLEVTPDGENHWDGNVWRLYRDTDPQTGPWTRVSQNGGHPNGENSPAPPSMPEVFPDENWAIRRWTSTHEGPVSVIAELAADNVNCGNGTTVHVFHNGDELDTLTTDLPDPLTSVTNLNLAAGDTLDLALTPEGIDGARGDSCDGSLFRMTVSEPIEPPPPVLADSARDWSVEGVQGENNWFNGYYNLTIDGDGVYQTDDFTPFRNEAGPGGDVVEVDGNHWTGTQWDLFPGGPGPWTEVGQENTHPNGTNSEPGEEHWTIRRFVADDLAGPTPLELNWRMRKTNTNGDGVTGVLLVNGEQVDSATISGGDGVGVDRNFYVNANPGDIIELALTPVGITNDADGADGSANRLIIDTELPEGPLFNRTGEVVADSLAEFSGEQGQDEWFYGYYDQRLDVEEGDGVYQTDDFIEFLNDGSDLVSDDSAIGGWQDSENHWDGTKWDLLANAAPVSHGPWTEVTPETAHPAANAQGDPEVHQAVRRWVSDVEGDVNIAGLLHNTSGNGDGTVGRILVDGEEIWAEASNGNPIDIDVNLTLSEGSIVDFVLDADGAGVFDPADPLSIDAVNDGSDGTIYRVRLERVVQFNPSGTPGDYDGDGLLTAADIDTLSTAVNAGDMGAQFDLNADGAVTPADRDTWVNTLAGTFYGDSNLDGEFNTQDLVVVFQGGQYEDTVEDNSGWATGDWNGDKEFNTNDLVLAFQSGGFETGPRAGVASVPEPNSLALMVAGLLFAFGISRRR